MAAQIHIDLANKVFASTVEAIFQEKVPTTVSPYLSDDFPIVYQKIEVHQFRQKVKVLLIEDDPTRQLLLAKDESLPGQVIQIRYGISERNENFNPTIQNIRKWLQYPITMNLLNVQIDEHGEYYPAAFILEPDYLIDVSAIANCFNGKTTEISRYLLKKFSLFHSGLPLVLGNISNYFLDELVHNSKADFRQLFSNTFKIYPLVLSLFTDQQIRELYQKALHHFAQLQKVIIQDLPKEDLDLKQACIEPSFYSEKYGLQGRLDLLLEGKRAGIIELKSGKVFRPNIYGLSQNHFIQTLLYDLLIESAYNGKLDP